MQTPLQITLELARADDTEEAYAFKPRTQEYILRVGRGQYRTVTLRWKQGVIQDLLALRERHPDPEAIQRMGNRLREFLVAGGWEDSERSIREAVQLGREVEITVVSGAAELYALPWELLTVHPTGQRLAQLPGVLIQYEWPGAAAARRSPGDDSPAIRVLFAWSAAGGAVAAGGHREALETSVGLLSKRGGEADLVTIPHVTREALAEVLARAAEEERPFRYVHIVCHGVARESSVGLAWNSSDDEGMDFVDPSELQAVLGPFADTLEAVVLMACHAGSSGQLDSQLGSVALQLHRGSLGVGGIPVVISSRTFLRLDVAELVTMTFYGELFGGSGSVQRAFIAARDAVARRFSDSEYAWLQLYRHEVPEAQQAADTPDTSRILSRLSRRSAAAVALLQVEPRAAYRGLSLSVTSYAGDGEVFGEPAAAPVVRLVLEGAMTRAAAVHGRRVTQQCSLYAPDGVSEPDLLGLAAAVAAIAAATGREVPPGWVFIGGFDSSGQPLPIRALARRLDAAAAAGATHVGLLADGAADTALERPGLTIHQEATLLELAHHIWPPRQGRRFAAASLALALTPLLSLLMVFDTPDLFAQSWLLKLMGGELPALNTVIVPAPLDEVQDRRELRARNAPLLDALVSAGVRAVAFDISYSAPDSRDEVFAEAIERAARAGVPVLLGVPIGPAGPKLPGSERLRAAGWPAIVQYNHPDLLPFLATGKARVRLEDATYGTLWHMGILALHARTRFATEPALVEAGGSRLLLDGQLHPVDTGRLYLHPAQRSPAVSYGDPIADAAARGVELRDKVVLVGLLGGGEDSFLTPFGRRSGLELHAALIETLAQGAAPRRSDRYHSTLLTLLVGAGAAAVSAVIRDRRLRALGLLVPAGGLIWVMARAYGGVSTDLSAMLLAGIAGTVWGIKLHDWRLERFGVREERPREE